MPDPATIGGVAIGTVIFNTLYWLLGFLRVRYRYCYRFWVWVSGVAYAFRL
ncbi:hypothetical protein [Halalkalibacter krulwichiae]|uniref:hypothetical protein n=1 Tax=Halalkalibacter krulwichiae TaxID=199441 RepID=UPI000A672299